VNRYLCCVTFVLGCMIGVGFTGAQGPGKADQPMKTSEPVKGEAPVKGEMPAKVVPKQIEITAATEVAGKTLGQWVATLRDPDPAVRVRGLEAMVYYGSVGRKLGATHVIDALKDKDGGIRHAAATAIGLIGLDDPKDISRAVGELTRLLYDNQSLIRYQAALTLSTFGEAAKDAVPTLAKTTIYDSNSFEVRKAGAIALGRLAGDKTKGPNAAAQIALAHAAGDVSAHVRMEAIRSLTLLGPPASQSDLDALKPILIKHVLAERDHTVAIWARVCLMRVDASQINEANLKEITKFFKNSDLATRIAAVQAIGSMGTDAKSKMADLIPMLKAEKPEEWVQVASAAWALGQMKQNARAAVPELEALSQHTEEVVRLTAAEAIERIKGAKQ
jgi:HEAT repeat protein